MSLTQDTFAFVADVVRRRSAIQLEAGKEYLVESRLLPLARDSGHPGVDAYIREVAGTTTPAERTPRLICQHDREAPSGSSRAVPIGKSPS